MAVIGLMALATAGGGLATAGASADRVSRGEAVAVFNAFGTGRLALLHHGAGHGAPADTAGLANIRPISGVFEGRHFCAEDWHVLSLATIAGGTESYTVQDAKALLDATTVVLSLDGVPLATRRTPVKRLTFPEVFFDDEEVYLINVGAIVSPEALSVGVHTLSYVRTSPDEGTESGQITFFIDAAGTGTCL